MSLSGSDAGLSKLNLLVVDDEASVLNLVCSMLEQIGVGSILSTHDSGKALDLFRENQNKIDVVLCDWNMPVLSGLEMLKIVRALKPDVAFMMVTGAADMAKVVEAKENGVSGYIKKPFSTDELRKKLTIVSRIRSHRAKLAA